MSERLTALRRLIGALDDFLDSGWESEGSANPNDPHAGMDPDHLACEFVEPGGDIHNAVCALQPAYGGKLPAPEPRNIWRELQRVCRHEPDPYKRQNEAHDYARDLRGWARREIDNPAAEILATEAPPDESERMTGVAPRNAWFLKRHEAEGTETYHRPSRIRDLWNGMTKEQQAKIAPSAVGKVTRDVVATGIKRARNLRDAKPSKRKRTAKKPK